MEGSERWQQADDIEENDGCVTESAGYMRLLCGCVAAAVCASAFFFVALHVTKT